MSTQGHNDTGRQLAERLLEEAGRRGPAYTRLGKVTAVDTDSYTCTVAVEGEPDYPRVRLYATDIEGPQGFILVPKQDSYVLISQIETAPAQMFVALTTELEEVRLVFAEGKSMILKSDGSFELQFDSLTLGNQALEPAVLGDTLAQKLKQFLDSYATHTHVAPTGTTTQPSDAATAQQVSGSLNEIKSQKTELE
jgi:hypothetical protein